MAAWLVSLVSTMGTDREWSTRYFFTFWSGSRTSTASTIRPLSENSLAMSSTSSASPSVLAPGGPELEQDNLAFDLRVVVLFAGGGFGAKAWGGLAGFIAREGAERHQREGDGCEAAEGARWRGKWGGILAWMGIG